MAFPWVRNGRGGGGDPFRDTNGRHVTNVRASIPASDALKEGMRESPGQLNMMDQNQYRVMLEDQMKQAKKYREAEEAELNATLWWEKKERREQAQSCGQTPVNNNPLPNVNRVNNTNQNNNINNGLGSNRRPHSQNGIENGDITIVSQQAGQRWIPPIQQSVYNGNMAQQQQQQQQYEERQRPMTSYSDMPSSSRLLSQPSTQRADAMEILVLDNSDLRRENHELKRLLSRYQDTFGPL